MGTMVPVRVGTIPDHAPEPPPGRCPGGWFRGSIPGSIRSSGSTLELTPGNPIPTPPGGGSGMGIPLPDGVREGVGMGPDGVGMGVNSELGIDPRIDPGIDPRNPLRTGSGRG